MNDEQPDDYQLSIMRLFTTSLHSPLTFHRGHFGGRQVWVAGVVTADEPVGVREDGVIIDHQTITVVAIIPSLADVQDHLAMESPSPDDIPPRGS